MHLWLFLHQLHAGIEVRQVMQEELVVGKVTYKNKISCQRIPERVAVEECEVGSNKVWAVVDSKGELADEVGLSI